MPELPEVENVRIALVKRLAEGSKLVKIKMMRSDLRFPMPRKELKELVGAHLKGVERRAKYILFIFDRGILVSHLGMTGHWREANGRESLRKHDHLILFFSPSLYLVYNDPRRFGYVKVFKDIESLAKDALFKHLGVEPLDSNFTGHYLISKVGSGRRSVKVYLMDQDVVVGIGNIYASEILFMAKVRPDRNIDKISLDEWSHIAMASKKILKCAIAKGGSSIRDYRTVGGQEGGFQNEHQVYGRAGKECFVCGQMIVSGYLGGRSTFWCPRCQS